jgi:hypothetical protein
MPKSLIAMVNARSRQSTWANAVRSTWMPQVPKERADIKFFVGRGEGNLPEDTVALDCDDSYQGLPSKIQAIARYAYSKDYEYVMKLDDDVVARPIELLNSGYDRHKYSGRANRRPTDRDPFWVPMGFAYWMDRDCMKIISEATLPPNNDDERWVAENLHRAGIHLSDDKRYHLYMGGLMDRPQRLNRPLRIGRSAQDETLLRNGFCWCIFLEVGGVPQHIPIETKTQEFYRVYKKLGGGV